MILRFNNITTDKSFGSKLYPNTQTCQVQMFFLVEKFDNQRAADLFSF